MSSNRFDKAQFVRYGHEGRVLTYLKAKQENIPDEELEVFAGLPCTACGELRRGVAYMGCQCDRRAFDEGRDWQEYGEQPGEQQPKELNLGPRMIVVRGRVIGTCDALSLTIAEATDEEIEELRSADEVSLVRIAGG